MGRGYTTGGGGGGTLDAVPPHLLTATVTNEAPAELQIVFDEPVTWPVINGFGVPEVGINGVSGSGTNWTMSLASSLVYEATYTLWWNSGNAVRDLAGNALAPGEVTIINLIAAPIDTAPRILIVTVTEANRAQLTVVFDQPVLWPGRTGFALGENTLVELAGAGTVWTLTLLEELAPSTDYTLSWDVTNLVTNEDGDEVLAPGSVAVLNELLGEFRSPELPRLYVDHPYSLPLGGTAWLVPSAYTLQAALDGAELGDVIIIQAGTVLTGPFTLRAKDGEGWIYIVSSALASLPAPGNRVGPTDAASMPRLESSTNLGEHVITAERGAHHYRLVGIEIAPHAGTFLYSLVQWAWDEDQDADFPSHITFDRCYVHGHSYGSGQTRRGLSLHGHYLEVVDSYLADFFEAGQDTQAFACWTGSGPYRVHNCFLEAPTENLLVGGIDCEAAEFVPSDIEITGNHFHKPRGWQAIPAVHIKNLAELKAGRRVLFRGNVFEHSWQDGQAGYGILFTVRNQNGQARWTAVTDVTFELNTLESSCGFSIHGRDRDTGIPSAREERIVLRHNVVRITDYGDGSDARIFFTLLELQDMAIEHNLVISERTSSVEALIYTAGAYRPHGYRARDNIAQMGTYGVFGVIEGGWSGLGQAAFEHLYADASWAYDHNVQVGLADPGIYPAGNWAETAMADVGFVNFAGGDYELGPASDYRRAASDGTDVGPNTVALAAATAHCVDGLTAGVAPRVLLATVENSDPDAVRVTTSKPVAWAAATGFAIDGHTVTGVSGSRAEWVLALGEPVTHGETLTLEWDATNVVVDAQSLPLAAGTVQIAVRVEPAGDVTPPEITAATVEDADPDAVSVTTSESVTWAAATGFAIAGHTVTGVTGAGTAWTLALGEPVTYGETLTLEWDATNVVVDDAENPLAADSVSITNHIAAPEGGDLGLHAASVVWLDETHVRITYDWTDADQLLDWTANGGGTLAISDGRATVTFCSANIDGMSWNQTIALSRIEANVRTTADASAHINVYANLDAPIGATYNPDPGYGALSNTSGATLTRDGGTPESEATRVTAPNTVYDVAFEVAAAYSRWSIDDGATWFQHAWTCPVTTDGILSLGGYDGCPYWGTLVIEGEVELPP